MKSGNYPSILMRQILGALAYKRVVCLGDSHMKVFHNLHFRLAFPFTTFDVVSVSGATASGLDNPNCRTQACKIFNSRIEKLNSTDPVVLKLGEVDTGFVIWWRAQKNHTTVDESLTKTVENYTAMIERLRFCKNLIVLSTCLPTIGDGANLGEVANLRREVKACQRDRTHLTLRFNSIINKYCCGRGVCYLNLDGESLDPETGLVKKNLLSRRDGDNHYGKTEYAKMLIPHLRTAFINGAFPKVQQSFRKLTPLSRPQN